MAPIGSSRDSSHGKTPYHRLFKVDAGQYAVEVKPKLMCILNEDSFPDIMFFFFLQI